MGSIGREGNVVVHVCRKGRGGAQCRKWEEFQVAEEGVVVCVGLRVYHGRVHYPTNGWNAQSRIGGHNTQGQGIWWSGWHMVTNEGR